jgi:hypothetical protein
VALWGGGASGLELAADAFKFVLSIAVKEGISTLVGELLFITLRVPPLQYLQVLPNIVLPRR